MIHVDYADGTSAWLTDEQLKERHPELYAALRRPAPYVAEGEKLRKIRVSMDYSVREVARMLGIKAAEVCDIELGRVAPTQSVVDFYGRLSAAKEVG